MAAQSGVGAISPPRRGLFGWLGRVTKAVGRLVDWCLIAGLASLLFVVLVQIAGRLVRGSFPWTEEATRYIFIWITFLGMSAGFRHVEHGRILLFVTRLPAGLRPIARHFYALVSIAFFLMVLYTGWNFVMRQVLIGETGHVLTIPMWVVGASVPVSAVAALLAIVESAWINKDTQALIEGGGDRTLEH